MANHVALTHTTQYRYSRLVGLGPHIVRLRPAPHCRTPILTYSLRIAPEPHFINWQQDPFGNFMARIVVPDETREFSATVDLVADMATINPFDFFVEDAAASWPFSYDPVLAGELKPYLEPLPGTPLLDNYIRKITGQSSTVAFIIELNRKLSQDIAYQVRMEPGVQTPEDTLNSRRGSCRDLAVLMMEAARSLGIASRFVSGYIYTPQSSGLAGGGATHAWMQAYLPGAGWIDFDPTNSIVGNRNLIRVAVAWAPEYVLPLWGTYFGPPGAFLEMDVDVRVSEVPE